MATAGRLEWPCRRIDSALLAEAGLTAVLFARASGHFEGILGGQAMDRDMHVRRLGDGATFKRSVLALTFLVAGLMILLGLGASVASAQVPTPIIHVLSNRAD